MTASTVTESFNDLLKTYQPPELFMEEVKKRNFFIDKVKKDETYVGGTYTMPVESAGMGSVAWGALTSDTDISEGDQQVGSFTSADLGQCFHTMLFNESDLRRHDSLKKSYLKLLPNKLSSAVKDFSEEISLSFFGDGSKATLTSNGSNGSCVVDHPERFKIGEKIYVDDGDSSPVAGYITAININTKTLTVKDARSSGSSVNLASYTTAQTAKVYSPGQQTYGPKTLQSMLLSAANSGDSTYAGLTKASFPILQAVNIDGSGFTAETLLDDLVDGFWQIHDLGKGSLNKDMIIPLSWFRFISGNLENNKRYSVTDKKVAYGMTSVTILGLDGQCTITGVRDKSVGSAFVLDWETLTLVGNSFFRRIKDANGNEFYVKRATTGWTNVVDTVFEAFLLCPTLSHNGIIHSIPTLDWAE